jgi:hypothetical protein
VVVLGDELERRRAPGARVVDENVDRAVSLDGSGHRAID